MYRLMIQLAGRASITALTRSPMEIGRRLRARRPPQVADAMVGHQLHAAVGGVDGTGGDAQRLRHDVATGASGGERPAPSFAGVIALGQDADEMRPVHHQHRTDAGVGPSGGWRRERERQGDRAWITRRLGVQQLSDRAPALSLGPGWSEHNSRLPSAADRLPSGRGPSGPESIRYSGRCSFSHRRRIR